MNEFLIKKIFSPNLDSWVGLLFKFNKASHTAKKHQSTGEFLTKFHLLKYSFKNKTIKNTTKLTRFLPDVFEILPFFHVSL